MALDTDENEGNTYLCVCRDCLKKMNKNDIEKAIHERTEEQEILLGELVQNQLTLYVLYEKAKELTKKKVK